MKKSISDSIDQLKQSYDNIIDSTIQKNISFYKIKRGINSSIYKNLYITFHSGKFFGDGIYYDKTKYVFIVQYY